MSAGRRTSTRRFRARTWLGFALAFVFGAAVAQDGSRIAYVDTQRLLDNAPQIVAARERLRQEFDRRDAALKADIARLAALDQRVAAGAASLPDAELTPLKRQAEAMRRSIERTQQRLREELSTRSDEEVDRVWPLISEAVADYARETGYDLVLQSPVVYASGRIDITDRVLDRLKRDFSQARAE